MSHTSLNVASHLARMAAQHPAQVAIHAPRGRVNPDGPTEHRAITFAELNADADAIAHGLSAAGVARGTRTALMVPPSPDFFALTFALFKVGAVPVLIDPGMGVQQPRQVPRRSGAGGVHRRAEGARRPARARLGAEDGPHHGERRPVAVLLPHVARARCANRAGERGPYLVPDVGARPNRPRSCSPAAAPASAKGVVYTHGIFAAQVELLKATYGIEPGEIDLCTFPLFALFGPALGMTCVIPDMDATRPATARPAEGGGADQAVRRDQHVRLTRGDPKVGETR